MARWVLKSLEDAETDWRNRSPEWKAKLQAWEAWKVRAERQSRLSEKTKKQKKDKDDEPGHGAQDASWESSFDQDDPSPQFSFAGTQKYSKSSLEEDLRQLKWTSTPDWAIGALRRGIGVHHSGMNKGYRSIVERYT